MIFLQLLPWSLLLCTMQYTLYAILSHLNVHVSKIPAGVCNSESTTLSKLVALVTSHELNATHNLFLISTTTFLIVMTLMLRQLATRMNKQQVSTFQTQTWGASTTTTTTTRKHSPTNVSQLLLRHNMLRLKRRTRTRTASTQRKADSAIVVTSRPALKKKRAGSAPANTSTIPAIPSMLSTQCSFFNS